jgi:hypothetical protein
VQVVGGEVRPEVGTVPEDRAVLHEAVAEEELLPRCDVRARVQLAAGGVDNTGGDRRLL